MTQPDNCFPQYRNSAQLYRGDFARHSQTQRERDDKKSSDTVVLGRKCGEQREPVGAHIESGIEIERPIE